MMESKIRNFRDLKVWQLGMDIVEDVYAITKNFPKEEIYGLTAQMRRSAVSMPSNVAEGFTRRHNKENVQFLYIALGSSAELETQIEISIRLDYLSKAASDAVLEKINHWCRMTMNLLKKL